MPIDNGAGKYHIYSFILWNGMAFHKTRRGDKWTVTDNPLDAYQFPSFNEAELFRMNYQQTRQKFVVVRMRLNQWKGNE